MVSFQRDGAVIEECTGCRGVFLDEQELTHLIETAGAPLSAVPANGRSTEMYEGRHRRD